MICTQRSKGVKGFFPVRQEWILPGGGHTHFSRSGSTVVKFLFTHSKLRDKHFFTKMLIRKYEISKSRGQLVTFFRLMFCILSYDILSLLSDHMKHVSFV